MMNVLPFYKHQHHKYDANENVFAVIKKAIMKRLFCEE
jgi:hypothetical protein